jgi:hypothetical protein
MDVRFSAISVALYYESTGSVLYQITNKSQEKTAKNGLFWPTWLQGCKGKDVLDQKYPVRTREE